MTAVGNATLGINLTLTRDARNGLLTGTALGSLSDSTSYNGFGEVIGYRASYASADFYQTAVIRDKLGRMTQKIEIVGGSTNTFDYAYDVAGHLLEVKQNGIVQSSYGYDTNGNRTDLNGAVIAHYDAQDRLLDYNSATYDYTANGELKTKTVGTATTRYSYDVLGNLRNVILPGGQNRRIGKKRNNVLEQGFLYQDPLKPIAELDGNNNIVSRFVYATGANVPDFMIKGGVTYRLIKDHLGSPRLVIDVATNTVIQQLNYDDWGKVIQDSNPGFQPFGYAGGLYDRDTHLVRFGARDYDAETGRWTAKDPIGFGGGDTNLYGYVVSDPVNLSDPTGEFAVSLGGAVIGAGGDVLIQLAFNGGRLECIKWESLGIAAGLGAVNPFSLGSSFAKAAKAATQSKRMEAARQGSRTARNHQRRYEKHRDSSIKELVSLGILEGTAEGAGNLFPNKCGCE